MLCHISTLTGPRGFLAGGASVAARPLPFCCLLVSVGPAGRAAAAPCLAFLTEP